MGNRIFGTPKKVEEPIDPWPTVQEQIKILEKRKTHLNKLIEINGIKAKEFTSKEEALRCLKLKAMYASELKTVFGMLDKLETLDNAHQRIIFQKDTLLVTKQATNVIKQNTIDPIKAEDIMDDIKCAIEEANEVSDILSRTDPPSEELQAELDALVSPPQEPPVAPTAPIIVSLPEVPVQVKETPMDKELRILVAN
jgi:hypothetical protein